MWDLITNPSSMGQTTCQAMSDFWNGMSSEKTLFCNKRQLLSCCMDDVNVLRQACCSFRNLFLKLAKMNPFREAITISSICKTMFRTMFVKPKYCKYYRKSCVPNGISPVFLKLFNGWRILVGQGTILLMSLMEGKFICLR